MLNNNNENKLYNQDNNINRRRLFPQDRPRANNNNNVNIKYSPVPNQNTNAYPINRNNNNNNLNQNRNTNNKPNDELGKAFLIIQRELRRKDNRILELERKIQELTKKLNSLMNNNNNNNFMISKNSPMMTPYKEEPKNIYGNNLNNDLYDMEFNKQNSNIINRGKSSIRNNNNRSRGFQISNLNYNSDNENIVKRYQGYDNLSHSNDNSVLTYNGVHSNSKKEVKEYLKEVKAKIDPKKFKEFISNIKLLTSKSEIAPNKEAIVENMKILFGKEHVDLFLRFEKIIGAGR